MSSQQERVKFPSIEDITTAIDPGRVPYIQLAIAIGDINRVHRHDNVRDLRYGRVVMQKDRAKRIHEALASFAEADRDAVPRPPLSESVSSLLQAAVTTDLLETEVRERWDDYETMFTNETQITVNHTEVALFLLQAIHDYGSTTHESQ